MRDRQLARCLTFLVLLVALAPGCQTFHQYRPVVVQVRDAENKQPIPGADVQISYSMGPIAHAPNISTGSTEKDGVTHLRAAPYEDAAIMLSATAKGYLPEEENLSSDAIGAIRPIGWFEKVEQRPVSYTVELYSGPPPSVELIVPNGYRGQIKAELKIQDDMPLKPGLRSFSYVVPPSGTVLIAGPAMLRRVFSSAFDAKFADGTPLSRKAKGDELGFWLIKSQTDTLYFLIGTEFEYDNYRRSVEVSDSTPGRKSGGGGRGRRHRQDSQ